MHQEISYIHVTLSISSFTIPSRLTLTLKLALYECQLSLVTHVYGETTLPWWVFWVGTDLNRVWELLLRLSKDSREAILINTEEYLLEKEGCGFLTGVQMLQEESKAATLKWREKEMRERPGMLERCPSKLKALQHRDGHCWPPLADRHSSQLCSCQHEPLLSREPTRREQPRWQNHHHEARCSLVYHHGHFDPRAGIFRSLVYAKQHLQHIRMKL